MTEFKKNQLINAITRAVFNKLKNQVTKIIQEKIKEHPLLNELFKPRGL